MKQDSGAPLGTGSRKCPACLGYGYFLVEDSDKRIECRRCTPLARWRAALVEIANSKAGCASAAAMRGKARWALSDSDGSPEGRDAQRLDGEAATARAEGIAKDDRP